MKNMVNGTGCLSIGRVMVAMVLPVAALAAESSGQEPLLVAGKLGWVGDRVEDTEVRTRVKLKLFDDNTLNNTRINVDVRNGRVTLRGAVDKPEQVQRAVTLAKSTPGVRSVESVLVVSGARDVPKTLTGGVATKVENRAVSAKIRAKLLAAGLYEGNDISVQVTNGVAILRGHVNTQEQYNKATNLTRNTDGVDKVINQLHVH